MNPEIILLNEIWDDFLMNIRDGVFEEKKYEITKEIIISIDTNKEFLEKELVTLLWYIPTYLEQNGEAWKSRGIKFDHKKYDQFKNAVENIIMEKLGIP